jgi:hypothetical protein
MQKARRAILSGCALVALGGWRSAAAQTPQVERAVKAQQNRDVQVGVYTNIKPDCTAGPLPTLRLATPPSAGQVTVKSVRVKINNYKACLAVEVPGYVALYKSKPDFTGVDVMIIEVKFPEGRHEIQKITVTVDSPTPQQKI